MTKKAAALLLAASLAVSVCAMPVFADGGTTPATPNTHEEIKKDDTTESSSSTTVEYKVTEGYTWAIPAKIDFGENAGFNKKRTVFASEEKMAIIVLLMRRLTVSLATFTLLVADLSRAQS